LGTPGGTGLAGFGGMYAAGGKLNSGGWGVVGERGAEVIKAHKGGGVSIFSNAVSSGMLGRLPGFATGGFLPPSAECGPECIRQLNFGRTEDVEVAL
jgi:hypothetical protein